MEWSTEEDHPLKAEVAVTVNITFRGGVYRDIGLHRARDYRLEDVYKRQYPSNGLTPVRLAEIFREADTGDVMRQMELFEEMEEHDPHLFSQLQTRKNAVTGDVYKRQLLGREHRLVGRLGTAVHQPRRSGT